MKRQFVCQECGASYPRWTGKCESCGSWNRIIEEIHHAQKKNAVPAEKPLFVSLHHTEQPPERFLTGMSEFDRVCGGGLVPGSIILVGGDPGIGKSTLLLQTVACLAPNYLCAYISGEEAVDQIRLRAQRLHSLHDNILLASTTQVEGLLTALEQFKDLSVLVIDSIQTLSMAELESAPGTVSQVRGATQAIINYAKKKGLVVFLIGHVTKEGAIAGPRVLEHMVDCVLYFEGEHAHQYRLLRAVKNRFGPTDEIGVFEMTEEGLQNVENPSTLFLGHHSSPISGSAIFAGIEGSRPILCEIQALVAPTSLVSPRRTTIGWDTGRLAMLLAVLEARSGLKFSTYDVFLNVAGGLRISEPAVDLAAAAALISARKNIPLYREGVFFGEIGLGGEVRPVRQTLARLREAKKLGFSQACTSFPQKNEKIPGEGMKLVEINTTQDLIRHVETARP